MPDLPSHIGPFEVRERLGTGGMGVVYLAYDPPLDRLVAVKVLNVDDDEIRQRFLREARFAARVQHPNIVAIYAVGEHDGRPYMAMEYIAGDTLASIIRGETPVAIGRRVQWLYELASGLEFAHRNGIVHRDVKPANLIVSRDSGLLRLLDFGIARDDDSDHTMAGHVIGTPSYMSPEQVTGGTVDARSDIFAFGLVAYELLSGARAFQGHTTYETTRLIVEGDPVPLGTRCPELPTPLVDTVHRCLAKSPERRPASLVPVRADLRRVLHRLDPVDEPSVVRTATRTSATATLTPTTSTGDREKRRERRRQQIRALVAQARAALEAGQFDAAVEAAEQADLFDDRTPELGLLLHDLQAERQRRDVEARLRRIREDIERGDLSAAEVALSGVGGEAPTEVLRPLRDAMAAARLEQRVDRCARDLWALLRSRDSEAAARRLAAEAPEVRAHPRLAELTDVVERARDEARRAAERRRQEAEARRQAEEAEARRRAEEAEARRRAEEAEERRRAEEEARRQAEEAEARRQAEEAEARRQAEEEARRQAEADAEKRRAEEAEAKRRAEEAEARRQAEEAEARRRAEQAEARRQAEEAARRQAEADAKQRQAEEAEARRRAEEAEARRHAEEAEARRRAEEAEARRQADEEARRKAEAEEKARRKAEEADARRKKDEEVETWGPFPVPTPAADHESPAPEAATSSPSRAEAARAAAAPTVVMPPAVSDPAASQAPIADGSSRPSGARAPALPLPPSAVAAGGGLIVLLLLVASLWIWLGPDGDTGTTEGNGTVVAGPVGDPPPGDATGTTPNASGASGSETGGDAAAKASAPDAGTTSPPSSDGSSSESPDAASGDAAGSETVATPAPVLPELRRLLAAGRSSDAIARWRQASDAPDRDAGLKLLVDRFAADTARARTAADDRGASASEPYREGQAAEGRAARLARAGSIDATDQYRQATAAFARAEAPPPPPPPSPADDAGKAAAKATATTAGAGDTSRPSGPDTTATTTPRPPPDPRPAVLAVLDAFAAAYNRRDLAGIAAVWPSIPGEWRNSLAQSFRTFSDVDWTYTDRAITVQGDTATATVAVAVRSTGSRGTVNSNRRYVIELRRQGGAWAIARIALQ